MCDNVRCRSRAFGLYLCLCKNCVHGNVEPSEEPCDICKNNPFSEIPNLVDNWEWAD